MPSLRSALSNLGAGVTASVLALSAPACESSDTPPLAVGACHAPADAAPLEAVSAHIETSIHNLMEHMRAIIQDPAAQPFQGNLVLSTSSGGYPLNNVSGLKRVVGPRSEFVSCSAEPTRPFSCQYGLIEGELTKVASGATVEAYQRVELVSPDLIYFDTPDNPLDMAMLRDKKGACSAFDANQWSPMCQQGQDICRETFGRVWEDVYLTIDKFGRATAP